MPAKKKSKPKITPKKKNAVSVQNDNEQIIPIKQPESKSILKKVLLSVGAVLVLIVVLFSIFILPFFLMIKNFAPSQTGKIDGELYAVNDKFVSMFVLKSGKDLIAFDTGDNINNVEAEFKKLGFDPLKVKAVFLTHSDGDHVKTLPLFKNATVYLPQKEEPYATSKKRGFLFLSMVNKIPVDKYILIEDGKDIKFGKSHIKAILTPGHTDGSTSYLINGKYLIVGDLAIIENGKLIPMPSPPSENVDIIKESIKMIEGIESIKIFVTSHTGILKK